MPISDNGKLNIFAIELIFPILIIIFSILILLKKVRIEYKKILIGILIFIAYYIILFFIRYFLNLECKQSLLTIKISIFPLILLFTAKYMKINDKNVLNCLVIFNLIINIIQLFSFTNIRMSSFLGNVGVYLTIIEMLFYINFYAFFINESDISIKIFSLFNILICLIMPLLSGSRSSFLIIVILTIIFLIYLIVNKRIVHCITMTLLITIAVTINLMCWNTTKIASYANRALPQFFVNNNINNEGNSSNNNVKHENNDDINPEFEKSNITNSEMIKSDDLRNYLFKKSISEIKNNPLIGNGVIYFNIETNYGVSLQSAHNFILEYINAYGIIGFVLYSLIHILILSYMNLKNKKAISVLCLSVFATLIQSLVEPTMLIVPIVTVFYILYYYILSLEDDYD